MAFESSGIWLIWIVVVGVSVWSLRASALRKTAEKPFAALRERRARQLGWRYGSAHDESR